LALAVFAVALLSILGLGILMLAYGARLRADHLVDGTAARLSAEAGYEKAIHWLSTQEYPLEVFSPSGGRRGASKPKTITLKSGEELVKNPFECTISLNSFLGTRPVYKIISKGFNGRLPDNKWELTRTVDANVVQAIYGWDMGQCAAPIGSFRTMPVRFSKLSGSIDMPIHINSHLERDVSADIFVDLSYPQPFHNPVYMAESRYNWAGRNKDKYASIIDLFKAGIYFGQNNSSIYWKRYDLNKQKAARNAIRKRVTRFIKNTNPQFNFSPMTGNQPRIIDEKFLNKQTDPNHSAVAQWLPAVQLEFYADKSGMVRITNNCAVACMNSGNYDYALNFVDPVKEYKQRYIYGYHYANNLDIVNFPGNDPKISDTYVSHQALTPTRTIKAPPGGQIYIDGNVIIGGLVNANGNKIDISGKWKDNAIKGKLTIVATGDIWIVSPITYYGFRRNGFVLNSDNQNVLGLFSQFGVVKVVDPSFSTGLKDTASYKPIAAAADSNNPGKIKDPDGRTLPNPMYVQAAITAAGGGWGVENIENRSELLINNELIFVGAISEVFRGLTKDPGSARGFRTHYYFDQRLLNGILPGDLWLQHKFVTAPGGWSDSWQ
jgi:hypothetical protein